MTFDVGTLYDMFIPTSPEPKERLIGCLPDVSGADEVLLLSLPLDVNKRLKLQTTQH